MAFYDQIRAISDENGPEEKLRRLEQEAVETLKATLTRLAQQGVREYSVCCVTRPFSSSGYPPVESLITDPREKAQLKWLRVQGFILEETHDRQWGCHDGERWDTEYIGIKTVW